MLTPAPLALALVLLTLAGVAPASALPDVASCPRWRGAVKDMARLEGRLVEAVNQQRLWNGRRTLWSDKLGFCACAALPSAGAKQAS